MLYWVWKIYFHVFISIQSIKKNYIVEIIKADFQEAGDEDVFRKIKKDLENNNIQDADIRKKMSEFLEAARQQI